MKKLNQKGFAHHLLIFAILALVVGAAGFAGWRVYQSKNINAQAMNYKYKIMASHNHGGSVYDRILACTNRITNARAEDTYQVFIKLQSTKSSEPTSYFSIRIGSKSGSYYKSGSMRAGSKYYAASRFYNGGEYSDFNVGRATKTISIRNIGSCS